MGLKRLLRIFAIVLLLAVYCVCFAKVTKIRTNLPMETKRAQALAIDPTLLKVISGPFKGLMADYLNIKAAVFMGGSWEVTEEDWEAVYTLLKQSLYLDPLFFQTGYYTQGLLAWRPGMHQRAVEMLRYHAEHRYWDWEPMFYVGFNYFYYLNDNESAAKYLKLSAERPGAPPIAASLAARLAQKAGHTVTAIGLLKTMYENAEGGLIKTQLEKRLKAHLAVYEIEKALKAYRLQHGALPEGLDDLVKTGVIEKLPENPFKNQFSYDPQTGRISFEENH